MNALKRWLTIYAIHLLLMLLVGRWLLLGDPGRYDSQENVHDD